MKGIKSLKDGCIYYVHENYSDDTKKTDNRHILLNEHIINDSRTTIYDVDAYNISSEEYTNESEPSKHILTSLSEGEYVKYHKENNEKGYFEEATHLVKEKFDDYYENEPDSKEKRIQLKIRLKSKLSGLDSASEVMSFHVNVGHGNCSFIVFKNNGKYELWAIDCSVRDFLINRDYTVNVNKCLTDIKKMYGIDKLSVLMVTHLHYDHINGIDYLIDNDYVDNNTEIWMNKDYPCNMLTYKRIKSKIKRLKCRIIIPTSYASVDPYVKVLYPDRNFNATNLPPQKHINNSSILYLIHLAGKSMLFTGDIETAAWKIVDASRLPKDYIDRFDYYCISHHGSKNGLPHKQPIIKGLNMSDIQILMGRDKAYSGIFSKDVFKSFSKIQITDPKCYYLKIQWNTGCCVPVFI